MESRREPKARQWFSSLRARLMLLVLISIVPALGLMAYSAAEQRRLAAQDAEREALRIARLGSNTQQRLIEGARQILIAISQLPEARGSDSNRCTRLLSLLMEQYGAEGDDGGKSKIYANFGIIERDGAVFASAVPMGAGVNLADRSYFQRAMKARGFAIGDYQIGRITGKATVNFGYPILDENGEVLRIVYAALNLEWVNRLAEQAELPEGSSLTVIDRNGTVLAQYPHPEKWIGRSIADQPVVHQMLDQQKEGTVSAAGAGGEERLFAFTPLSTADGAGFVCLNVGIPRRVAFAKANEMQSRNMLLLSGVGVMALGLAWFGGNAFFVRWITALLETTRRLTAGDLSARVGETHGPREINALAHSFDEMASTLEQRTQERTRAEEALKTLNQELEQRVAERTQQLQQRNEQMEEDLRMARELQQAILPQQYPAFSSFGEAGGRTLRFHHRYLPTGEVGGDFFHVRALSESTAALFLCDVMGHGVRSALVTAMMRALVEELSEVADDPGRMLARVNDGLCDILRQTHSPLFATAFYMMIDCTTLELRYAKAGHPDPLLIRPSTNSIQTLKCSRGGKPALGLFKGSVYQTFSQTLNSGDWVMLFTDGLYEIETLDGSEYDEKRLREAVARRAGMPADEALSSLMREIQSLAGKEGILDDVCIVAVEVTAIDASIMPEPAI